MGLQTSVMEALRLTRSGNLVEATALLQATLGGRAPAVPPAATPIERGDDIIDLMPDRVSFQAAGSNDRDAIALLETRTFSGSGGVMNYRLYRPARFAPGMPLVVMLHGCTQSPEDFARGTGMNALADELGFIVAYPEQSRSANAQKCWNWFRPGDQQRDRGEPGLLAGVTRAIIAEHDADPARIYIAGLSAGGAAAAIMASEYPDIYAAVGVHSGLACGSARDLSSALSAMKQGGPTGGSRQGRQPFVPVITFHGSRDATVHEINSRQIVAAAATAASVPLHIRVEQGRSGAGRAFSRRSSVDPQGSVVIEQWTIEGAGHAWAGGDAAGSYTDPKGPDASREMIRFFLAIRHG